MSIVPSRHRGVQRFDIVADCAAADSSSRSDPSSSDRMFVRAKMMRRHLASDMRAMPPRGADQLERLGASRRGTTWTAPPVPIASARSRRTRCGFRRIRIAPDAQALRHLAGVGRAVCTTACRSSSCSETAKPRRVSFIQRARQDHLVIDRNAVVGKQPRARFGHRGEIDQLSAAQPFRDSGDRNQSRRMNFARAFEHVARDVAGCR